MICEQIQSDYKNNVLLAGFKQSNILIEYRTADQIHRFKIGREFFKIDKLDIKVDFFNSEYNKTDIDHSNRFSIEFFCGDQSRVFPIFNHSIYVCAMDSKNPKVLELIQEDIGKYYIM